MKAPAFQFYTGDWMKDPALRPCSIAARGLWIDMLSLMFESPRRGYLQHATGKPVTAEQIARMTGCSTDEVSRLLQELDDAGVFSRTDSGVILSRRLVRDERKRELCRKAGLKGGNPTLKGGVKGGVKGRDKPKPTPSSSSSSSSAEEEEEETPTESHGSADPTAAGARKAPETVHHQAVACFCEAWQARYGEKYPFDGRKHGKLIKEIRKHAGEDLAKIRAAVARFFDDDSEFVSGAKHDLGLFRSQLARWIVDAPPGRSSQPPRRAYSKVEADADYVAQQFADAYPEPPR